jgi:hypothetical protein
MPIDISYLDNGTGLLYTGRGLLTGKDVLDAGGSAFASREKARSYQYGLADYSRVLDLDISNHDLEQMVILYKKAAEKAPGMCVALVGVQDFVFGIARIGKRTCMVRGGRSMCIGRGSRRKTGSGRGSGTSTALSRHLCDGIMVEPHEMFVERIRRRA